MSDDRFQNARDDRPIFFNEYLRRVVKDPSRKDELEILIMLFGNDNLDLVLQGKLMIRPSHFMRSE